MNHIVLIFVGGGLGSLVRYGMSKSLAGYSSAFPAGILAVNILACLILGIFSGWAALRTGDTAGYRAFLAVGFCGGFSTFSTFSNDTVQLFMNNYWTEAILNIALSLVFCLGATILGMWIGKQFLAA